MHTFAEKPKATQQAASPKATVRTRSHFGHSHEVNSILHLQRMVGNQAVQRLLRSGAEEHNAESSSTNSPHFGHDSSRIPVRSRTEIGAIQTRLTINKPGDEYEQEADRIAEQMMRMSELHLQRACTCGGECTKCQTKQHSQDHERLQINRVQASRLIQRDLATPPPTPAAPPQPDLTEEQIREAIRFNRRRYDEANTRLIQDILGGPVTGNWTRENILAIAATQEEYGLRKDGKVGPDTFRFIAREQTLVGAGTTTAECLTMFRVVVHPLQTAATPGPGGTTWIRGHHVVDAQFSNRCNCAEFQYRQFIAGVATGSRGPSAQPLSGFFQYIPGGQLPITDQEDGMTNCPGVNYGHREQPAQNATTASCGENRYMNNEGATDQANGCIYRGEDFPQITANGLNTGDDVDLLVEFRGEIRRNGHPIQTRRWITVDTTVRTP